MTRGDEVLEEITDSRIMDLENIEPHQLSTNLAELFQQVVEHSKVRLIKLGGVSNGNR